MSGMNYKTFQENFKLLTQNNATQDQIFDMLITPFVSALHYHTTLSLNQHHPGDMIISHSSDKQRVTVYPDTQSTIIFRDVSAEQEIAYNDHTLIVEFDCDNTKIQLVIPYFGKYVVNYSANFYDNETEYNTIISLIDYNVRKTLNVSQQKKFFYQLAVIYDLQQKDKVSQMLVDVINKLIKNEDSALINLLVNDITKNSSLPSDQIRQKILAELSNQTKDKHYLFTHTSLLENEEKDNQVVNKLLDNNTPSDKLNDQGAEEDDDPLSSFMGLSDDKPSSASQSENTNTDNNKKQGEEENVSNLFKQR